MNHRILGILGNLGLLAAIIVAGLLPVLGHGQQPGPPDQPKTGQPGQPIPGQPTPGQGQPTPGQPTPGQPTPGQPGQPQPVAERRPPALEYALALIATLLVLVIICMPSRKG